MTSSGSKPALPKLLMHIADLFAARRHQLMESAQVPLGTVIEGLRTAQLSRQRAIARHRSVCRLLPELLSSTATLDRQLSTYLESVHPSLYWTQKYDTGPVSDTFFDNYGHATLVGADGPAVNTSIKAGLIILGAGELYPKHAHPAGEFYAILSGFPDWQIGDGAWHRRQPGDLIHHEPQVPHATRTKGSALLAIYAWYGTVHGRAHFV